MSARASTRISIRWPPAEALEPTDTLVLSVGEWYVDLRVSKEDGGLDWGLAGQRIVVSDDPLKVKFTHSIDSHHLDKESDDAGVPPDVGDFTKLPNGDDLETGEMPAPHLGGKVMPYEEIWREFDPNAVEDNTRASHGDSNLNLTAWILESIDQQEATEQKSRASSSKSFYARIGKYFVALRQMTSSFSAIRQDFDLTKGSWKTKHTIGNVAGMPTMETEDLGNDSNASTWKAGDRVTIGSSSQNADTEEVCIVRAVIQAHSTD